LAVVRHVLVVMDKAPAAVHLASSLVAHDVFAHVAETPERAVRILGGNVPLSAVLLHRDTPGAQRLMCTMVRSGRMRELPVVIVGDEEIAWKGNTVVTDTRDVDGLLDLLWRVC
jgi:PleD family two-component response regulator